MSENKIIHIPRSQYPETLEPAMPILPTEQVETQQFDLMAYWHIIVARRRTILAILVTVIAATMIWTFKQTPIYRAETTVQIDRENPNVLDFKDIYENASTTDDTLRTQFEVLKSRSLARRVIEELRLAEVKEFQTSSPGALRSHLDSFWKLLGAVPAEDKSDPLNPIIDEYLKRLDVSPVRLARLASVRFESEDPELAAKILNTHARDYVLQNLQYKWNATKDASDFLAKELVGLKSNLEKAEDQLQAYSRKNRILFTDEESNTTVEKLQQLDLEHTKAQADRIQKESFQHMIETGNGETLPQLTSDPLTQQLLGRLVELRRQESELSTTFQPEYPTRQRVRNQITELEEEIKAQKERLIETIKDDYAASAERERLLTAALEEQRNKVNQVNQDIIQYNILKREADSNKQLYDGLLNRLKQAEVSAGLSASNIRIVDPADTPKDPVRPRKVLYLALSVLGGLLVGVGAAFLQESLDDSVKTSEEVLRYFNAATLGIVPRQSTLLGKHGYYHYGYGHQPATKDPAVLSEGNPNIELISHEAPSSVLAESYRSIRTSLLVSSPDRPPRIVLVTSTVPSEGKTTTASNIAISLTQTQSRVVLIDCDMRKPRVHNLFDLKGKTGLSSFLTGMATIKEVIHETKVPNLFVIPCGAIPPNPGELIVSNRFKQFLETLTEYFDYIIIDSPPVANASDARVLAASCERTILVVKAGSTPRRQVQDAAKHLMEAHAQLAGVVLNDLDFRSRPSYYSYSASYYSGYGDNSGELSA